VHVSQISFHSHSYSRYAIGIVAIVLAGAAAASDARLEPPATVQACIEAAIDGVDPILGPLTADARAELHGLYRPHPSALWVDASATLTTNAVDALALLGHADDDGLDVDDYYVAPLRDLATRLRGTSPNAAVVAAFDVTLSAGMLRYLRDVHMGRLDPRALAVHLGGARDDHDFAAVLRSAIADGRVGAAADALRPQFAQYRLLRAALARYRTRARETTAAARLPPFAAPIHRGEAYSAADVLRQELAALGDLPPDAESATSARLDDVLVEGLKRFQRRHGLQADGVLGKTTYAALTVPLSWRVREIELSLERLRWLPHLGDERLIALNIPMFRLWAWEVSPPAADAALAMDVIVGRALSTQTPVFAAKMREVIFRPYWNVPTSILRHEVLPKLARDPDYLRHEDMEIVRGEGDTSPVVAATPEVLAALRRGELRVRQRPGPKNALGSIKFVFPNDLDVYMHGTPAQALFARSRRDFSHGCVRVFDPIALAAWVLEDRPEWTRARIAAAAAGAETIHVTLPRPIQVIMFYSTAAVMPDDGTLHFAEDIYQQDAMLDRALAMRRGRN